MTAPDVTHDTARGVRVHRPRGLSEDELDVYDGGFRMQTFVRDPMIVIGDRVIEAALRLPARFKERFGLRPVIEEAEARGARCSVMPPPAPVPVADLPTAVEPFLEGGDVLPMGRDILVGTGRAASDAAGARWLERLLGDDYRVHQVPLSEGVIHLDDGLTTVREGLAVVCREQFTDGLPAPVADWELIDVSLHDAVNLLAGNSLVLAPGETLVDERLTDLAEALTARDVTVHTLPYDAVTPFAGGFRCSHHPLVRNLIDTEGGPVVGRPEARWSVGVPLPARPGCVIAGGDKDIRRREHGQGETEHGLALFPALRG
ncbi:amidinotransferase [Streptomyces sp. NPDC017520]|uniref:amidinotransferase n=1 Tax=Streptomyces sp. NPDC017520 TaxID=3364998 RepID=UPI00379F1A62